MRWHTVAVVAALWGAVMSADAAPCTSGQQPYAVQGVGGSSPLGACVAYGQQQALNVNYQSGVSGLGRCFVDTEDRGVFDVDFAVSQVCEAAADPPAPPSSASSAPVTKEQADSGLKLLYALSVAACVFIFVKGYDSGRRIS